jgi:adenylate kinase family enzyme
MTLFRAFSGAAHRTFSSSTPSSSLPSLHRFFSSTAAAAHAFTATPQRPVRLVFLGAPGVGKGSVAEVAGPHFGVPLVSTGAMIREEVSTCTLTGLTHAFTLTTTHTTSHATRTSSHTPHVLTNSQVAAGSALGKELKGVIASGSLVDDAQMLDLVRTRLAVSHVFLYLCVCAFEFQCLCMRVRVVLSLWIDVRHSFIISHSTHLSSFPIYHTQRDDCAAGFLLDGFPRRASQAAALKDDLGIDVDVVLQLDM